MRKPLSKEFEKLGFSHRQVKRFGDFAIYARRRMKGREAEHFEVIKIGGHDGYTIKDKATAKDVEVPPSETYPSSEAWGSAGWTFLSLPEAEAKFQELLNARKAKVEANRAKK